MALTLRFGEALAFAAELHAGQLRKGTSIPYVSHLLSVCALVLEDDGDEDEAIAALLHDAAEDQGGEATLRGIERRFGPRVARIVAACSDSLAEPKPPFSRRPNRRTLPARPRRLVSVDLVRPSRAGSCPPPSFMPSLPGSGRPLAAAAPVGNGRRTPGTSAT